MPEKQTEHLQILNTIVGAFGSNRKKRAFKLESTYQEGIFGVDIMN